MSQAMLIGRTRLGSTIATATQWYADPTTRRGVPAAYAYFFDCRPRVTTLQPFAAHMQPHDSEDPMISDSQVRHDVEAELDWDGRIDSREIGVAVKNGVVTLTGRVGSYLERRAAEEAAQSVEGVKAVANDIIIEPPFEANRSDAQIAEAAVGALQGNVSVPANSVKIYVRDGWITLEGEVSTWHQKNAAEVALASLHGIKGVTNNVVIRAQISIDDVQSKIADAFRRRAQLDARNIRIQALEGTVTLEGEVSSWHERNQAEIAAWQAPGVSNVVDKLTVKP